MSFVSFLLLTSKTPGTEPGVSLSCKPQSQMSAAFRLATSF